MLLFKRKLQKKQSFLLIEILLAITLFLLGSSYFLNDMYRSHKQLLKQAVALELYHQSFSDFLDLELNNHKFIFSEKDHFLEDFYIESADHRIKIKRFITKKFHPKKGKDNEKLLTVALHYQNAHLNISQTHKKLYIIK